MVRPLEVKLRNDAAEALSKGRHQKALRNYQKLEKLRPNDATWPRKSAEIYRSLGQPEKAIESYTRASAVYAECGLIGKAIAVCNLILRLAPDNKDARNQLEELTKEVTSPLGRLSRPPAATISPPLPDESQHRNWTPMPTTSPPGKQARRTTGRMEVLQSEALGPTLSIVETTHGLLKKTTLLSALSDPELNSLVEKVRAIDVQAGKTVFVEGDLGMTIYIVRRGRLVATREGPPRVVLAEFGQGEFFGEIELFTHQPRSATLTALIDTKLLAFDKETILELTTAQPKVFSVLSRILRERLVENLVKTSPLFSPFVGRDRDKLISRFAFWEVKPGVSMLTEGKDTPGLYVVMSGVLKVTRARKGEEGKTMPALRQGDIFGALSLLAKTGASATVSTVTKCLVLELPANAFREVIAGYPWVLSFVADLAAKREQNA